MSDADWQNHHNRWIINEAIDDYADATIGRMRVEIGRRVGTKQKPRSPIVKPTANSLVAYLTGEFAVRPAYIHVPSAPPRDEIVYAVAQECDLGKWKSHYSNGSPDRARPFRKDELVTVLETMDERGDQREWT